MEAPSVARAQTEPVLLEPGRFQRGRTYVIRSRSSRTFLGNTAESTTQSVIRKEFVERGPDGFVFRIRLQKMERDFDPAGARLLSHLQRELVVRTDRLGTPQEIVNRKAVHDRWLDIRRVLETESSNEILIAGMEALFEEPDGPRQMLMSTPHFSTLLPGIFGHFVPGRARGSVRSVRSFLFDASLPLATAKTLIMNPEAPRSIEIAGEFDARRADHKRIRQTAKIAAGRLDIRVDASGESEERYELDCDNWMVSGRQVVTGRAGDVLANRVETTIEARHDA